MVILTEAAAAWGFHALNQTLRPTDCCFPGSSLLSPDSSFSAVSAVCCGPAAVLEIHVANPPTPLQSIPPSIFNLRYLANLSLAAALEGPAALASFERGFVATSQLKVVTLRGNATAGVVVNGMIPTTASLWVMGLKKLDLEGNDLSGYVPADLAAFDGTLNLKNNPRLAGPLPNATSGPPVWSVSRSCDFNGTAVCLSPTWNNQPACLGLGVGLPYCGAAADAMRAPPNPAVNTTGPQRPDTDPLSVDSVKTVALAAAGAVLIVLLFSLNILCASFLSRLRHRLTGGDGEFNASSFSPISLRGGLSEDERRRRHRSIADVELNDLARAEAAGAGAACRRLARFAELPVYTPAYEPYVGMPPVYVEGGGDGGGGSANVDGRIAAELPKTEAEVLVVEEERVVEEIDVADEVTVGQEMDEIDLGEVEVVESI
ncbi:hypothetical protein HK101_010983 [Irineochytrium annulatum]|nr:hypothetical protein HK101_010983 [Irineochytrium annulatum]